MSSNGKSSTNFLKRLGRVSRWDNLSSCSTSTGSLMLVTTDLGSSISGPLSVLMLFSTHTQPRRRWGGAPPVLMWASLPILKVNSVTGSRKPTHYTCWIASLGRLSCCTAWGLNMKSTALSSNRSRCVRRTYRSSTSWKAKSAKVPLQTSSNVRGWRTANFSLSRRSWGTTLTLITFSTNAVSVS